MAGSVACKTPSRFRSRTPRCTRGAGKVEADIARHKGIWRWSSSSCAVAWVKLQLHFIHWRCEKWAAGKVCNFLEGNYNCIKVWSWWKHVNWSLLEMQSIYAVVPGLEYLTRWFDCKQWNLLIKRFALQSGPPFRRHMQRYTRLHVVSLTAVY